MLAPPSIVTLAAIGWIGWRWHAGFAAMTIADYMMYKCYRAVGNEYDEREFRSDKMQGPIEINSTHKFCKEWGLLKKDVKKKRSASPARKRSRSR